MTDTILLTVDSLRADYATENYFPECWDLFTSEFARFKNAYANGVATVFSFPNIHSGHPVVGNGQLDPDAPTIAELYDGYAFAISNNPHLIPERGYDRGFDFFIKNRDDATLSTTTERSSPVARVKQFAARSELIRKTYRFITDHSNDSAEYSDDKLSTPQNRTADTVLTRLAEAIDSRQGLFWGHLMDVHYPFTPQSVFDRDLEVAYSNREIQEMNTRYQNADNGDSYTEPVSGSVAEDIHFLESMYGELVKYLDRQIAVFFDGLKQSGRWDDALVVVLSDHGEAFGEHGVFNHDWTADPIDELVRVPLFVKYPDGRHAGECFDHVVQNADLFATLAEELSWDVTPPDNTAPFTNPTQRDVVSKSNTAVRVTTSDGYAIRRRDGSTERFGELDEDTLTTLRTSEIPDVESRPSDIQALTEAEEQRLAEQLDRLGYT